MRDQAQEQEIKMSLYSQEQSELYLFKRTTLKKGNMRHVNFKKILKFSDFIEVFHCC